MYNQDHPGVMFKTDTRLLLIVIIGGGGGFLSGVAGLGGGAILVPLVGSWLSTSPHQAQASSLLVIVMTAAIASARYAASTNVEVMVAATIAMPGIVFGLLGALIAENINPNSLKRLFGIRLLAATLRMTILICSGSSHYRNVRLCDLSRNRVGDRSWPDRRPARRGRRHSTNTTKHNPAGILTARCPSSLISCHGAHHAGCRDHKLATREHRLAYVNSDGHCHYLRQRDWFRRGPHPSRSSSSSNFSYPVLLISSRKEF